MKPPSSLSAHLAPVVRPARLPVPQLRGRGGGGDRPALPRVSVDEALDYVAGYTVANDWGVHDFRHADRGSMLRVKGQDGFCPLGPVLVDAGDVDPDDLTLRTFVNGEQVQHGHTGTDLMFSFAYQIADVARLITLEPGDVLLTGTPANSRPVEPGDVVAVEVEGIGRLENHVVQSEEELAPVGEQPAVTAQTLHVALAIPEDEAERRSGGSAMTVPQVLHPFAAPARARRATTSRSCAARAAASGTATVAAISTAPRRCGTAPPATAGGRSSTRSPRRWASSRPTTRSRGSPTAPSSGSPSC